MSSCLWVSRRELDGAWPTGRDAHDGDALDAERIEQCRREVSLLLGPRAPPVPVNNPIYVSHLNFLHRLHR
jgi:hypothetical protein